MKLTVLQAFGQCTLCDPVMEKVEVLAGKRPELVELLIPAVIELRPDVYGLPADDYGAAIPDEPEKRYDFFWGEVRRLLIVGDH
jgi:hypothetical protein